MKKAVTTMSIIEDNRIMAVFGPIPDTPMSNKNNSLSVSSENANKE